MKFLKQRRQALGLTQRQAAELCKISRYYYIEIELGRNIPAIRTAKKIATAMDFAWQKLYEDDGQATD